MSIISFAVISKRLFMSEVALLCFAGTESAYDFFGFHFEKRSELLAQLDIDKRFNLSEGVLAVFLMCVQQILGKYESAVCVVGEYSC